MHFLSSFSHYRQIIAFIDAIFLAALRFYFHIYAIAFISDYFDITIFLHYFAINTLRRSITASLLLLRHTATFHVLIFHVFAITPLPLLDIAIDVNITDFHFLRRY